MKNSAKGYIFGAVSAVSYGTNPLFAVPLYALGLMVASVLVYRYTIATVIIAGMMIARRESFRLTWIEALQLLLMGVLFALSSVALFGSYQCMDVGLASTLLFVQPVFIAIILRVFFKERISLSTICSIAVCMAGIGLLCNPGEGANVSLKGVGLVMVSAVSYGIYMVLVNKTRVRHLSGLKITFYSLLFGQLVLACATNCHTALQPIPSGWLSWGCLLGLSLIPTIVSLVTVAICIKYVGSVTAAVLGALEPVTGIIVGAGLFGEVLTLRAIGGIILILASVVWLILSQNQKSHRARGTAPTTE